VNVGRTPEYEELLDDAGARWGEWLGVRIVEDFGDPEAEYTAAVDRAVLADRSGRGTAVATGTEVVPLLQGVVTSDLFRLAEEGSGQRSCAANTTGRFVCELRFLHVPDLLLMDFEPGVIEDGALSHFRANVITEDARFIDRSANTSRVAVVGPDAPAILGGVGEFTGEPGALADYDGTWGAIGGHDVIVQRVPTFGLPAFDLMFATDAAIDVWRAITEEGASPAGNRALEVLRIEAGVPRWGAELDEKIIPLEAGFREDVAFDKGCYVGQEIIARLDTLGVPAKMLRTLALEGDEVPEAGTELFRDGKKVGTIRSAVFSPKRNQPIALAYVKRDHNDPGTTLRVGQTQEAVVEE
jgi:folate-binding protein YgfZ